MRTIVAWVLFLLMTGAANAQTTITLKSGGVVQGKVLQETLDYIKLEAYGVPLTIYKDEIEDVTGTVTEVTVEQISQSGTIEEISAPEQPQEIAPPEVNPETPLNPSTENAESPGPVSAEKEIVLRDIEIDGLVQDWVFIPTTIEDQAGDMKKAGAEESGEEYDVKSIRLAWNRKDLFLQVQFAKNLDDYFTINAEHPKLIGTFFFDTDNSSLTGGKESFTGQGGFESQLAVWVRLVRDSDACVSCRGVDTTKQTHYFELVVNVKEPSDDFLDTATSKKFDSLNRPDMFACQGQVLEGKVPLEDIGLGFTVGQKARVLFREEGGGQRADDEEAFSPPVVASFQQ